MAYVSQLVALEEEYRKLRDVVSDVNIERDRLISFLSECSSFEDLLYNVGIFICATKNVSCTQLIYNLESFYQRNVLPFDTELINDNNNDLEEMEI